MNKIIGAEYPIKKIFSNEFDFVIPTYQRPYAWTTEHATELFDDFKEFMETQDENEAYFLGSIVLIKEETIAHAEVIDGHQRLTTLTILLAVIASFLEGDYASDFQSYVNEPGKRSENLVAKPRLALRERDCDFFRKYVQESRFDLLLKLDSATLSESQRNIRENSELYIKKLKKDFGGMQENIGKFGQFIVNRCYLVAVSTPNMQSAYRIFSVLNNRGMDLLPTDILKADIIGKIPENRRKTYTNTWDEMEEEIGRDEFKELFSHIRMIFRKVKAKATMLEEFKKNVLKEGYDPIKFIEDTLKPYADSYKAIRDANFQASCDSSTVNMYLKWLLRIDNSDWIPPAMVFLTKNDNDIDAFDMFFESLERLAGSMLIRKCSNNVRIDRYSKVITAIEEGKDLFEPASPLMLSPKEIAESIEVVSGDVYLMTQRPRTYLILRLDSFLSDKIAVYEHKNITLEHVLPQNINDNKYWNEKWPNKSEREKWIHKLGNLVLLSRRKNSRSQNRDFIYKKETYFKNEGGVTSFALTTKVLEYKDWTPECVQNQQNMLVEAIKRGWNWE